MNRNKTLLYVEFLKKNEVHINLSRRIFFSRTGDVLGMHKNLGKNRSKKLKANIKAVNIAQKAALSQLGLEVKFEYSPYNN
jgi:hypothetical protein